MGAGWLYEQLYRTFNNHVPLVDVDGDGFSTVQTFRGSSWRGRDCDDVENTVYPGRNASDFGVCVCVCLLPSFFSPFQDETHTHTRKKRVEGM